MFEIKKIKKYFDHNYFARGEEYYNNKRVEFTRINDNNTVFGIVRGSGRNLYQASIHFGVESNVITAIKGNCSCPVGYNCKHVVAILLEVITELQSKQDSVIAKQLGLVTVPDKNSPDKNPKEFVEQWLKVLDDLASPEIETVDAQQSQKINLGDKKHHVLYVLDENRFLNRNEGFLVRLYSGYLKKDGTYSQLQPFNLEGALNGHLTKAVAEEDLKLLRTLFIMGSPKPYCYSLQGDYSSKLLFDLVSTRRFFWKDVNGLQLFLGEEQQTKLGWQEVGDESAQKLALSIVNTEGDVGDNSVGSSETVKLLMLDKVCYLDPIAGKVGLLKSDLPMKFLQALPKLPEIPAPQVERLNKELNITTSGKGENNKPNFKIPLAKKISQPVTMDITPTPVLSLFMGKVTVELMHTWPPTNEEVTVPMADLLFDYAGERVNFFVESEFVYSEQSSGKKVEKIKIPRKYELEDEAKYLLSDNEIIPVLEWIDEPPYNEEFYADDEYYDSFMPLDENSGLEVSTHLVEILEKEGWVIEFSDDWQWKVVDEPEQWYAELEESDNQWFELGMDVDINGKKMPLLPILVQTIKSFPDAFSLEELKNTPDTSRMFVTLEDGSLMPLQLGKVRTILATLIELYDEQPLTDDGKLRLNQLEVVRMSELKAAETAAHMRWLGGEKLLDLGDKLRNFKAIAQVSPPENLKAELRDYQHHGLNWLQFLRDMQLGGVLADDMGLGKTVQALSHLLVEKQSGRATDSNGNNIPSLVIAPTSLMVNWRMEAEKFTPDLNLIVLHGSSRKELFSEIAKSDVVVTTYPLAVRDKEELLSHNYHLLILDEAQVIKNPKAKVTQIMHTLQAQHRICLSGTPMENHLGELWSLMHFLNPGMLGDEKQFRRLYRNPIEKGGDQERQQLLQRRVAPFLLRRTKHEVASELPEKNEIIQVVKLEGDQQKLYESIRLAMHEKVRKEVDKKGISRSHIIILDALLKLRQVCCDPKLLKLQAAKTVKKSAKLEMLMQLLPEMIEEGRKILLFSQFTSMLKLIEVELKKKKIDFVKLTGNTKDRETPVKKFQAGEVPLFLISLKAGGTGLNLTAADSVIHYDPWWNPAVENQATDRAHRIGQDKTVFVYKFITEGTVEEKILELQKKKSALVNALYQGDDKDKTKVDNGEAGGAKFSTEDLQLLLEPIS